MGHLDKDLSPLVEETEWFTYVFGQDFEKMAKEHLESIHSIKKTECPDNWQLFRQGRPFHAAQGAANFLGAAEATEKGVSGPTKQAKITTVQ